MLRNCCWQRGNAVRSSWVVAPWSLPWAADATRVDREVSRLRERASTSRWEIAVAGRQNAARARGRCTRARISRHRGNRRSLASGDVCDACRHSNPSLLFSRDFASGLRVPHYCSFSAGTQAVTSRVTPMLLSRADFRRVSNAFQRLQAIACGIAFFHLFCDFRISSTTSRIAPSPPLATVT